MLDNKIQSLGLSYDENSQYIPKTSHFSKKFIVPLTKPKTNLNILENPAIKNQLLIIAGDDIEDANGVVGQTNPAISAINILRSAETEYGIEILPNGTKWSSYRYEEGHGLKVIQEDEQALAILLDLSKKIRMIGLSTALANGIDVSNWFGCKNHFFYNFKPEVRPVPISIHF